MGLKEAESTKKRTRTKVPSIDEPVNSSSWKCVVVMAVEKTASDNFALREFMEESNKGRRQQVKLINFESNVLRILSDFAAGELPYKYAFLLNFKSIFQEGAECITNQTSIPMPLLVKIVKALLFHLRDESLALIEKKVSGTPDPVKAMADRSPDPGNPENFKLKGNFALKQEKKRTGKVDLRLRPPSMTKAETKLLKRGEGAKDDQLIEDSPLKGSFDLYVLLTGFYQANLPLELIKAGIPLHGLLCIDTSLSDTKDFVFTAREKFHSRPFSEEKFNQIHNFWKSFLKLLWEPKNSHYFKDTIFQVYAPRNLMPAKKIRKEHLYQEISYLMYDLSDLSRQLQNYLSHMNLRKMSQTKVMDVDEQKLLELNYLSNECVSVPVLLQYLIDAVCFQEENVHSNSMVLCDTAKLSSSETVSMVSDLHADARSTGTATWSQIVKNSNHFSFKSIYRKTKELDARYNLKEFYCSDGISGISNGSELVCFYPKNTDARGNISKTSDPKTGIFGVYWDSVEKSKTFKGGFSPLVVDNCLYSLLFTRVVCPHVIPIKKTTPCEYIFLKKNSDFELIEDLQNEMQKPHFTVTEGSRSALRSVPYNVKKTSKDFFCLSQLKIVSPEKLKALSAPEFFCSPHVVPHVPYTSDINVPGDFFLNFEINAFENLRDFLGENCFLNVAGFDVLEELGKDKLLSKEELYWKNYNCTHYIHSVLTDSLLVVLHNRKNKSGAQHETFNETLKTEIGLRDFFEYVLEDESEWLKSQDKVYKNMIKISSKKNAPDDSLKRYSNSLFWMDASIKHQMSFAAPPKNAKSNKNKSSEDKSYKRSGSRGTGEKSSRKHSSKGSQRHSGTNETLFESPEDPIAFEGYDVSDMAVQFSGIKSSYFACECTVDVELTERLYGKQNLDVRISQVGHTLCFHSFVCPVPHLLEPYVFHLACQSGIFLAFGRRLGETFYVGEEDSESEYFGGKSFKNSSGSLSPERYSRGRTTSKTTEEQDVSYDMALSLPNGLSVAVTRNASKSFYIKQTYLAKSNFRSKDTKSELSRMILSNRNVIKMLKSGKVQVLMANSSVVTASLKDLAVDVKDPKTQEKNFLPQDLIFTSYEEITTMGYVRKISEGKVKFSKKLPVFQKTDMWSNTVFSSRKDGTYCMLQNEGILCVQFSDDTKISSFPFVIDLSSEYPTSPEYDYQSEEDSLSEEDFELTFVFVHMEVVVEHPDYVTVTYNTYSRLWKIFLPFDTSVIVEPEGCYFVHVDKKTKLKVNAEIIEMNRFSESHELLSSATVDLSVFDHVKKGAIYCQVEDVSGKAFVVEPNSNCYVVKENRPEQRPVNGVNRQEPSFKKVGSKTPRPKILKDSVVFKCNETFNDPQFKLSRDNKYLVARRDVTGLEIFHIKDVEKILSDVQEGSLIFTQVVPGGQGLRCFVLISPSTEAKKKRPKWSVLSTIPDPKSTSASIKMLTSSTYAQPPSWTHPFPKKKKKFKIPKRLTCRVFFETKKTELSPSLGLLDTSFMEMKNEEIEIRYSKIEEGVQNIEKYIKKLSNDDQEMLKEMYALVARDIMIERQRLKLKNLEKFRRYLEMSKYHGVRQEYLKKSIKNREVPNYFQHPAGMCWLLVNEWINVLKLPIQEKPKLTPQTQSSSSSFAPDSIFSSDEIEYDLTVKSEISYSDLSYCSDVSARTAPAILTRKGVCGCKVRGLRATVSAPIYKLLSKTPSEDIEDIVVQKDCDFLQKDLEALEGEEDHKNSTLNALQDLMVLGLI